MLASSKGQSLGSDHRIQDHSSEEQTQYRSSQIKSFIDLSHAEGSYHHATPISRAYRYCQIKAEPKTFGEELGQISMKHTQHHHSRSSLTSSIRKLAAAMQSASSVSRQKTLTSQMMDRLLMPPPSHVPLRRIKSSIHKRPDHPVRVKTPITPSGSSIT
ncbi:hypothetical protein PROFUN_11524 [Planoprotostelium fungivorum]|uniref:Uncharacterized protein n=1 Tax=Planoprotostelium fungivorum TaxID=1890364 RepID=A0A2P6NA03_9EUKA|nr:hypothetical protein PROFUN_11524 [Planoprotostelium fungivorum]